jgi:spore germination cell wall hydrolase CwlJ-like protein
LYSKNIVAYLLCLCCILFLVSIVLSIRYQCSIITIKRDIKEINKRVGDLESSNQHLLSYELENNRLKDKIASYEKEIEKEKLNNKKVVTKYSDSDLNLLAQLIESESGTQPFEGKLAVGTVVMNRVKSDEFPDNIREVIFQKGQFSPVSNGKINNKPSAESLIAAKEIMKGIRVLDSNVLYFYNPKISTDKWIRTLKVCKSIGDHVFAV